jgi:hypothetical protein
MLKRLAASIAALGLILVVAGPALATFAEEIHQAVPIPWNATVDNNGGPVTQECSADELAQLQPGQVLWHFVGHFATDQNVTMSATFTDSQYNVTDQTYQSDTDHYELDWEIITGETTLTYAAVNTQTDVDGFNLSHICSSPPVVVPEAPMSALLLVSAGLSGFGWFALRRRQPSKVA